MNELINPRKSVFEQIRHVDENGVEYWSAREMAKVLEYSEYRHFLPVIEKAKEACANSNNNPLDHFEDILEMVSSSLQGLTGSSNRSGRTGTGK